MAKFDERRADDVWMKQIWPLPADQKSNGCLNPATLIGPSATNGHIDIYLDSRNMPWLEQHNGKVMATALFTHHMRLVEAKMKSGNPLATL